jgi:hypothetical protein
MDIRSRLHTLLTQSNLVRHDFSSSVVKFGAASTYWAALADDARALQWELRQDARQWFDLVAQIVADRGEGHVSQPRDIRKFCEAVIEQSEAMWESNTDEAARRPWRELDEQMVTLKALYSESQRSTFIPDTNALIDNPALEEWDFVREDAAIFELVLTPIVLASSTTSRPDVQDCHGRRRRSG